MLALEDHGHAAGAEPIEDPVIAQDQPEGGAGIDAGRLVHGDQAMLDQQAQRLVLAGAVQDAVPGQLLELFPVLGQHQ